MTETGIDNKEALLVKDTEISKLQARLGALEATIIITTIITVIQILIKMKPTMETEII